MIEIKNLFFSYSDELILRGCSLQIQKNEFMGIIGPNGGGKTTLLKLLMGFLKPQTGTISVSGKMGYVPQVHKTDRDFPITVREIVLLGGLSQIGLFGKYPPVVVERTDYWLSELGLTQHQNKVFGSLSGGLAQRALFARSLVSDPDILLLDEPTANIDAPSTLAIYEILQQLKGKKTILLVTHDLKTIVEKVDRIICVQKEVSTYLPQEVCEHFALGLYHTPLLGLPKTHFQKEHIGALR